MDHISKLTKICCHFGMAQYPATHIISLYCIPRYIFSTEGHLLPISPEISLVHEHCSYVGSFCKGNKTSLLDVSFEPSNTKFYTGLGLSAIESVPASGNIKVWLATFFIVFSILMTVGTEPDCVIL